MLMTHNIGSKSSRFYFGRKNKYHKATPQLLWHFHLFLILPVTSICLLKTLSDMSTCPDMPIKSSLLTDIDIKNTYQNAYSFMLWSDVPDMLQQDAQVRQCWQCQRAKKVRKIR